VNPKWLTGLVKPIAKSGEFGRARPSGGATLRAIYRQGVPAGSAAGAVFQKWPILASAARTELSRSSQSMVSICCVNLPGVGTSASSTFQPR
jgi:hypothetical protein